MCWLFENGPNHLGIKNNNDENVDVNFMKKQV